MAIPVNGSAISHTVVIVHSRISWWVRLRGYFASTWAEPPLLLSIHRIHRGDVLTTRMINNIVISVCYDILFVFAPRTYDWLFGLAFVVCVVPNHSVVSEWAGSRIIYFWGLLKNAQRRTNWGVYPLHSTYFDRALWLRDISAMGT